MAHLLILQKKYLYVGSNILSLGSLVDIPCLLLLQTAEENQAELKNYDSKVYKASRQMAEALTLELRALRIPFFSIKQSSISDGSAKDGQLGQSGNQTTLSKSDLSAFQRRMLELLQDLCKE